MFSLLIMAVVSCGDKEEMGDSTGKIGDAAKAKLYDKTWYPSSGVGGVNFTFKSNGEFIENKSLIGSWNWINNGDTMNITSWDNQKYKMLFDEIADKQIKWRSNLLGDNFKTQFTYKDTE